MATGNDYYPIENIQKVNYDHTTSEWIYIPIGIFEIELNPE